MQARYYCSVWAALLLTLHVISVRSANNSPPPPPLPSTLPLNYAWTMYGGNGTTNIFGTAPAVNLPTYPGSRRDATLIYAEPLKTIFLFGGYGYATNGSKPSVDVGYLGDLWAFDLTALTWTLLPSQLDVNAKAQPLSNGRWWNRGGQQVPSCRQNALGWYASSQHTLYIIGGYGKNKDGQSGFGFLGDMWTYNVTTGVWDFEQGDDGRNTTRQQYTLGNLPGCVWGRMGVATPSGDAFFMFGGSLLQTPGPAMHYSSRMVTVVVNPLDVDEGLKQYAFIVGNACNSTDIKMGSTSACPSGRRSGAIWSDGAVVAVYGGVGCNSESCSDTIPHFDLWIAPIINQTVVGWSQQFCADRTCQVPLHAPAAFARISGRYHFVLGLRALDTDSSSMVSNPNITSFNSITDISYVGRSVNYAPLYTMSATIWPLARAQSGWATDSMGNMYLFGGLAASGNYTTDLMKLTFCSAGCALCKSLGLNVPSQCLACDGILGFLALDGQSCVVVCPRGQFINSNGSCALCSAGCNQCASLAVCQNCTAPLLLAVNRTSCVGGCDPVQYVQNAACYSCNQACAWCDANSTSITHCACDFAHGFVRNAAAGSTCTFGCSSGYWTNGTDCLRCSSECATCNGPLNFQCLTCDYPRTFNGTHCNCALGYVLLSNRSACVTACPIGQYNSGIICAGCSPGCQQCTSPGLVVPSACQACAAPLLLAANRSLCVGGCDPVQYAQGAACHSCNPACTWCDANSTSLAHCECDFDHGYVRNAAAGLTCTLGCSVGFWSNGTDCLSCSFECGTCNGPLNFQCLSCNFPRAFNGSHCNCQTGYVLLNDRSACVKNCPEGQFNNGGICSSCAVGCALCVGYGLTVDAASECQVCDMAVNYSANAVGDTCVPACETSEFKELILYTSNIPYTQCVGCDVSCVTCTGNSYLDCTSCNDTNHFQLTKQGSCGCIDHWPYLLNDGSACVTECPLGYYPDSTGHCELCDALCANCSKLTASRTGGCYQCAETASVSIDGTMCLSQCPSHQYSEPLANLVPEHHCAMCAPNCTSCVAPDEHHCTACDNGFGYFSGCCIQCHPTCRDCLTTTLLDPTLCLSCYDGRYLSLNNDGGAGSCVECDVSCSTCVDGSSCQTCAPGYNRQDGSALCSNLCTGTGCVVCEGVVTNCTRCHGGWYQLDSANSTSNGTCAACESSCASCTGPDDCADCDAGLYLVDGECVGCASTCFTCSGPGDNQCLDCAQGFVLQNAGECIVVSAIINPPGGPQPLAISTIFIIVAIGGCLLATAVAVLAVVLCRRQQSQQRAKAQENYAKLKNDDEDGFAYLEMNDSVGSLRDPSLVSVMPTTFSSPSKPDQAIEEVTFYGPGNRSSVASSSAAAAGNPAWAGSSAGTPGAGAVAAGSVGGNTPGSRVSVNGLRVGSAQFSTEMLDQTTQAPRMSRSDLDTTRHDAVKLMPSGSAAAAAAEEQVTFTIDAARITTVAMGELAVLGMLSTRPDAGVTVQRVQQTSTYTDMVLKTYSGFTTAAQVEAFVARASQLHNLHHSHCVPYYGLVTDPPGGKGHLGLLLKEMQRDFSDMTAFSSSERRRIILDTTRGLAFLHGSGVVHGRLWPSNILLDSRGAAALSDYGLHGCLPKSHLPKKSEYVAPEVAKSGTPSMAGDVYALARLIRNESAIATIDSGAAAATATGRPKSSAGASALPLGLDATTMRALTAEAGGRPSVQELLDALLA